MCLSPRAINQALVAVVGITVVQPKTAERWIECADGCSQTRNYALCIMNRYQDTQTPMLAKLKITNDRCVSPRTPASAIHAGRCAAEAGPSSSDYKASQLHEGKGSYGMFRGG